MTTSEPSLAGEIAEAAKAKGVHARRCPGLRRRCGRQGSPLSIMIGGDTDVVEALRPLFEAMGKTIIHQGRRRRGPAHQDGQPDPDRHEHDRRLRGAALRLQGGLDLETVLQASPAARREAGA